MAYTPSYSREPDLFFSSLQKVSTSANNPSTNVFHHVYASFRHAARSSSVRALGSFLICRNLFSSMVLPISTASACIDFNADTSLSRREVGQAHILDGCIVLVDICHVVSIACGHYSFRLSPLPICRPCMPYRYTVCLCRRKWLLRSAGTSCRLIGAAAHVSRV